MEVKDGKVHFSWKDYRTNRFRQMKHDIDEFIRRFLLHVLPKGFFKVRYYGIFSSRYRKQNIEAAKQLLAQEGKTKKEEDMEDGRRVWEKQDTVWCEIRELIKSFRQPNCPVCKKGKLRFAGLVKDLPWEPGKCRLKPPFFENIVDVHGQSKPGGFRLNGEKYARLPISVRFVPFTVCL